MTRIPHDTSGEPNPLDAFSLDQLRRRTSMKWRTYPEDVLPVWVAEMDVAPPGPVVRAVTEAMESGDTGYPAGTAYAEALAASPTSGGAGPVSPWSAPRSCRT